MGKGFWMQSSAMLWETAPTLDELAALLSHFEIVNRNEPSPDWEFGGASLVVAFRPEVNGYVVVDIVDRPWPDGMGDPQNEPTLFGAWSMGYFGPHTFPGGLERAVMHAGYWPDAQNSVGRHRAFVRLSLSYVLGAQGDALVAPDDRDALAEAHFLIELTRALSAHPRALCMFNPNGEILLPPAQIDERIETARANDFEPLDLWCNVRQFHLNDGWMLMDTVGMEALDAPDHEAVFQNVDESVVAHFLLNIALYRLSQGDVIGHDETADSDDGTRWQMRPFDTSLSAPPRPPLRWMPQTQVNKSPVELGFNTKRFKLPFFQ